MKLVSLRRLPGFAFAGVSCLALPVVSHAADPGVTYKCPGHIYSNTIGAKEAKERNCTVLDNAPVSVIQAIRPRGTPVPASGQPVPSSGANRVDPGEQRVRDNDARRILEAELKREQDRLAALKADFNDGQPERQGNERNYQKYLERVDDMKSQIARKESDIAALKREISKQPL